MTYLVGKWAEIAWYEWSYLFSIFYADTSILWKLVNYKDSPTYICSGISVLINHDIYFPLYTYLFPLNNHYLWLYYQNTICNFKTSVFIYDIAGYEVQRFLFSFLVSKHTHINIHTSKNFRWALQNNWGTGLCSWIKDFISLVLRYPCLWFYWYFTVSSNKIQGIIVLSFFFFFKITSLNSDLSLFLTGL